MRLDQLLKRRFPSFSRTYFQYLIKEGYVLVNGSPSKKRETFLGGEEVEVCFVLTPELSLQPEDIALEILYEDDHLIAINKPAGMVVHPAPGHPSKTFVNALLFHCRQLPNPQNNLRPGIVHRLDKDTSGALIAAKTEATHRELIHLFSTHQIQKYYWAICIGNPATGEIRAPIGRHPIKRKEMAVREGGKEAISRCTLLRQLGDLSLLEIELITGRTHQIRVHLQFKGTPILGDPVYGKDFYNKKFNAYRQMLHAHRLCFFHPITKKKIDIRAPCPKEMLNFLD